LGLLDVSTLIERVESLPTVVPFPGKRPVSTEGKRFPEREYILCDSAQTARRVRQRVAAGDYSYDGCGGVVGYGVAGYLGVSRSQIQVDQLAPRSVIDQMAALLLPILRSQPCRILGETAEVTRDYQENPEKLFD
jgi:hypothetical protein